MSDEIKKALTVGELKKLLSSYPDDMPVATEGCDCIGPAGHTDRGEGDQVFEIEDTVVKTRVDGLDEYDHIAPYKILVIGRNDRASYK